MNPSLWVPGDYIYHIITRLMGPSLWIHGDYIYHILLPE